MLTFLARHGSEIKGVLSGWDRVRFRGTIRWLASRDGLGSYLGTMKIRLKEFREWSMARTEQINAATERLAHEAGRPLVYLPSSSERKELRALQIAQADGVTSGLIAVLKCVEPCSTFGVGPNAATRHIELRAQSRKCSHLYFYELHPEFGLMHLRLQTWVPFTIHVCLNGRDWLVQRLKRAGIGFDQRDNCLVDVDDLPAAQQLLVAQLRRHWPALLDGLVRRFHPAHRMLFGSDPLNYYWSAEETEWATDVLFRSPAALARIYPSLLHHAMTTFGSRDVLRFLGQLPRVDRRTTREIVSSVHTRPEGTRVKHASGRNSIKMYDKQQSVLRVETTINDPWDLKVYRPKEGDPAGPKTWQRMRKGVADLHRRAQLSQKSNERYLAALAATDTTEPLSRLVQPLCQPTEFQGRRLRALQPFSTTDQPLLAAVLRGEFTFHGFRNRDLRALLFGGTEVPADEARRQAAKITRLIRLLRGHGLIQKVTKTHRYMLTNSGRTTLAALQIAQQTNPQKLSQLAL
jgi:hypothetical protein